MTRVHPTTSEPIPHRTKLNACPVREMLGTVHASLSTAPSNVVSLARVWAQSDRQGEVSGVGAKVEVDDRSADAPELRYVVCGRGTVLWSGNSARAAGHGWARHGCGVVELIARASSRFLSDVA